MKEQNKIIAKKIIELEKKLKNTIVSEEQAMQELLLMTAHLEPVDMFEIDEYVMTHIDN